MRSSTHQHCHPGKFCIAERIQHVSRFWTSQNDGSQKGFTLVELLVYMGIFAILILVLLQIFTGVLEIHSESQATSSVAQDGGYIFARLSYDIGQSTSITLVDSHTLQLAGSSFTNTYKIVGSNFDLVDNTNTSYQLNSALTQATAVSFTLLGNPGGKTTVQITLTLQSVAPERTNMSKSQTFTTTIGGR